MSLANLSDEQLKHFIMQIFHRFDTNGDGNLEAP